MIDVLAEHIAEMRLIVEGAVALFDRNQGKLDSLAVDLIGEGLYLLREHIEEIQAALLDGANEEEC